ncbi:MAG: hypothetical protein M1822_001101 [Bathelium mastoideum]|nr:MAG: hypothetical protein M1822_001101 [Bathelium mastoideum]
MLIVSHRKPSYAVPINEYSPPELSSDLKKGFFDKPGLMQQSQHEKAMPVLPTPAVEDVDPFNRPGLLQQSQHKTATPLLPTPAVEDVDPFDNYMSPTPLAITAPTAETLTTASHTRGAVDMLPDISDTSSPAHSPSAPQRSSTQRRSRFLEARFSRDEPGPLNFDTQASPEQIQTPTTSPGLRETASPSPRPVSSPSPTVPRVVVRSPSGSRRNRPLSGLWRSSSSKVRRETAIDLKAGRGGLALNPVVKHSDDTTE